MNQYEMIELIFNGDEPVGSHVDVNLFVEFENDEKVTNVKGFYAGNSIYKVRFLPEQTGFYKYKVKGIIEDSGSFVVKPPKENKKGLVKTDGTHLKFKDETYYFPFGTTVYALAHQTNELIEETFNSLKNSAFNKVRMCVFPKHYNYNHNDPEEFAFNLLPNKEYKKNIVSNMTLDFEYIWDVNRPNFCFWDNFEDKIKRLDDLGIQVDLILFHPYDRWGFSSLTQKDNLTYIDYLLRRFSAMPNIWWSLANEYDLCFGKTLDDWYEIENFIAENDPYQHLLSNHNCFSLYDFSREKITHCSIQKRTFNLVNELQEKFNKPVLYDECVYEGNLKETWGAISGKEMVNRFWKVVSTGGYCTHGEVLLDRDIEDPNEAVLWWAKGGKLRGESPKRIEFLRGILEEIGKPLNPRLVGLDKITHLPKETAIAMAGQVYPGFDKFINNIFSMDEKERLRHMDAEANYAGNTEDESAILYYYGSDCCGTAALDLPEDKTYKIEVIDAWNMTREAILDNGSGNIEVKLPGREYIAVLATMN